MSKKATLLPDLFITIPALLLISLGVLVIYSSDPKLALQQGVFALLGFLVYWVLSLINPEFYRPFAKYFYCFILFLLIVVFVIGMETRGSVRWIPFFDMVIQPSELAKPALILLLANFWSKHSASWMNIIKSFLIMLPVVGLVFKQPDLGTTLTLLVIWMIMLVGANISILKIIFMSALSLGIAPLTWIFLKDYQRSRILSFISPNQDPLGIGYNAIQSMIAVGSGGLFGRGLGRGTQSRLQFLPEFRTDFIFASIAEEFGFVASFLVLILYGFIFIRSLKVIQESENRFGSLLIFGVLGMLFFQITVNIGMNTGLLPITGITLPLLSHGGSSLLSTLTLLSFIVSVGRFSSNRPLNSSLD